MTCAARCYGSGRRQVAATRIPAGNLFRRNAADARPEIYAMGLRNPFRIEIDPTTDALYVG